MNEIQHELQQLTESMERLSPSQPDFQRQRQTILIKTDRLKKEFRESLVRMQIRQSVTSNAIPSDDVSFIIFDDWGKYTNQNNKTRIGR